MTKEKPDIWFEFLYEAIKKTGQNEERHTDGPEVFYYQGNKIRCQTYALASAIKYLFIEKITCGVDHLSTELIQINQQDPQIVQKVNDIIRKMKKRKLKEIKKWICLLMLNFR